MSVMENLLNLFHVDAQVRGLRTRLASAERFLNAQQRKLNEVNEERAELAARRKQHQARIANLENEVAAMTERIEKLRGELNVASTSKEYTALLTEVNTFKAERAELETQVIAEMESVEQIAEDLKEIDTRVHEHQQKCEQARKELEERTADVGDRLSELEAERSVAASAVDAADLDVFNELSETYDGEALTGIEIIDKRNREYACGACNMHVPFETVSRLLSGTDGLVRCNVCRRILYMQDEVRGAFAAKK